MRSKLRILARVAKASAIWKPGNGRLLWQQCVFRRRNEEAGFTDLDHLRAAAEWLERAQDANGDGGVCGRYRLRGGWTSSYPETTGYIVPTFMALASRLGQRFHDRARRSVEFLLRLQHPDGAFPAGEVHEGTNRPSMFNTAQIISGLLAWHKATGETRALAAARAAGDWLVSIQDVDGGFRKHTYMAQPSTYSAHATCWLAQLGRHLNKPSYLEAASKHLDWVLSHVDKNTGWFDLSGFSREDHLERKALTHTIAYTIWGVLATSEVLERTDGIAAARRAALRISRRSELAGRLPGILDAKWQSRARFTCLTGNAQMALIWFRLNELKPDLRLLNSALKALDQVKVAQPMFHSNPAIRGAIPGSDPIWGDYIYMSLPNWSAKFFIDALMAKDRALAKLENYLQPRMSKPSRIPPVLAPEHSAADEVRPLRVLMYTGVKSSKLRKMIEDWNAWGFKPAAVVAEACPRKSLISRLCNKIYTQGALAPFKSCISKLTGTFRTVHDGTGRDEQVTDVVEFCSTHGIPLIKVTSLESDETLRRLRSLEPDLAIHAGAGILRDATLSLPRLGTLNAHMGLLPSYRGVNVTEWAKLSGDPAGCTVHLVDSGIDTGPIICTRPVRTMGVTSIEELRRLVDDAQISLLGEVVRFAVATGFLPPLTKQKKKEGVQFFEMHSDLRKYLERCMKEEAHGKITKSDKRGLELLQ